MSTIPSPPHPTQVARQVRWVGERVGLPGPPHAIAGFLASRGHEVRAVDRDPAVIEAIASAGAIELGGKIEARGELALATTNVGAAVRGASLIMVVVPGDAHHAVADALAPHVGDAHTIVLHPGGCGGALEFTAAFRRRSVRAMPLVAEVESFSFGSKTVGPGRAQVKGD